MHLKLEQVLDLIDGTMNINERPRWDSHVQACGECRKEFENWSRLLGVIKRPNLVSTPPETLDSGKKIFSRPILDIRPSLRQIVATVVFDSFLQPAVAGIRAELAVDEQALVRQVILRAEDFDVHIRISKSEDRSDWFGQILPRGSRSFVQDANLYLRRGEERISSANVNELGEFQFPDVPDEMLSLQVDLPFLTVIMALNPDNQHLGH